MKIGFFDSGLGGLTILKAVRELLPEYDYLYFGDTANLPYGDKTEDEIYTLTSIAVKRLFDAGALIVVIACNTASAETLRRIQETMLVGEYANRKALGVIIPTIEALVESNARKALLIGTRRTIASQKYERELEKISAHIFLESHATPKLVPYIESGNINGACTTLEIAIRDKVGESDTIVLGCTHYTVLKEQIRDIYKLKVISQDEIIPHKLKTYLTRHDEIESNLTRTGSIAFEFSAEAERYSYIREHFLN